jgi:hypothetical protein
MARNVRHFVIAGIALLAISTAFPVVAGLSQDLQPPAWMGYIDVALALVLVLLGGLMVSAAKGQLERKVIRRSYRLYRGVAALPLILLVIFFLVGSRIKWEVLLPGLAWRTWLLMYALPAAVALWVRDETVTGEGVASAVQQG